MGGRGEPRNGPVLVAGAGGFLGGGIVRALADRGWAVRGLARSPDAAGRIARAGGTVVFGDVLDPAALRTAVEGCAAIVHVAAHASTEPESEERLRRTRVDGARNLARAARAAGVPRLVVGSGYWVYAGRSAPIDEDAPLDPRGESAINWDAERAGFALQTPGELEVSVVRPGMVYGDGSWFRSIVDRVGAGSYRLIDGGPNPWSFVSLRDAGTGFVTALERGAPGVVYNLVDGDPRPWGEFVRHVAARLGSPPPPSCSAEEAAAVYGPDVAHHLSASRPTVALRLRALGWHPADPHVEPGVDRLLREMGRG